MRYNLNSVPPQSDYSPIPPEVYRLEVKLRPGGFGENKLLRLAKNCRTSMLDIQYTVIGGEYNGRRLWDLITVAVDDAKYDDPMMSVTEEEMEGYRKAVLMGLSRLRGMLESAHAVARTDDSERARKAREFDSLSVFDGLQFWAKVGIKKGQNGYSDKNVVLIALTPDLREWPGAPPRTAQPSTKTAPSADGGGGTPPPDDDDSIPF